MATDINRTEYLESLKVAQETMKKAASLGTDLAKKGIKNIFLVGCGAPNREMGAIKYFLDRDAKNWKPTCTSRLNSLIRSRPSLAPIPWSCSPPTQAPPLK